MGTNYVQEISQIFTDSPVKRYISLLNKLIFTDSSVKKYFVLLNLLIFTEVITKI